MVVMPLARSAFARAHWLVLAPHADDETLGAGALIAETARGRRLAGVVFLTDGSGSHSFNDNATRERLVRLRRREARLALRRLAGKRAPKPTFLSWKDAHPNPPGSDEFARSLRKLEARCRTERVTAIAVTAQAEPHCDHVAAFELARAVCQASRGRIALFQYHVWSEPGNRRHHGVETADIHPGVRRHALRAHRTQLTASFGEGFRLPQEKTRMASRDILFLKELRLAA